MCVYIYISIIPKLVICTCIKEKKNIYNLVDFLIQLPVVNLINGTNCVILNGEREREIRIRIF